jgi:hypothetical protein
MTPHDAPAVQGGHTLAASLARKYDGAVERPREIENKNAAAFSGGGSAGASGPGWDGAALAQFSPNGGSARKPESASEAAASRSDGPRDREAGDFASGQTAPQQAAAKTGSEDFAYTYLSPAQSSYDFPKDHSRRADDSSRKLLADIALRLAAAGAVGYLLLYSNLPYLIGLSSRKRRQ